MKSTMMSLKEKVGNKQKISGALVSLADPSICEMIGYLGYDFIWVDMEHSYLSCKDVFIHANAAKAAGTPVLVRVPQNDLTYTKRILEMGVDGIIFPMVHNAQEAEELLSYTLYPPYGQRGFGPQRAVRYYLDDTDAYVKEGHLNICRFIQIEHVDAVNDIERIAKNPYLDGVFFGPNDLSGSINKLGNVFDSEVTDLVKRTVNILKKHNKAIGVAIGATDTDTIRFWHDMGINMIAAGQDYGILQMGMREILKRLKAVQG